MLLFLFILFCFQVFILFCCIAAGNTPRSRALSDEEQMAFLTEWKEKHRG